MKVQRVVGEEQAMKEYAKAVARHVRQKAEQDLRVMKEKKAAMDG